MFGTKKQFFRDNKAIVAAFVYVYAYKRAVEADLDVFMNAKRIGTYANSMPNKEYFFDRKINRRQMKNENSVAELLDQFVATRPL